MRFPISVQAEHVERTEKKVFNFSMSLSFDVFDHGNNLHKDLTGIFSKDLNVLRTITVKEINRSCGNKEILTIQCVWSWLWLFSLCLALKPWVLSWVRICTGCFARCCCRICGSSEKRTCDDESCTYERKRNWKKRVKAVCKGLFYEMFWINGLRNFCPLTPQFFF